MMNGNRTVITCITGQCQKDDRGFAEQSWCRHGSFVLLFQMAHKIVTSNVLLATRHRTEGVCWEQRMVGRMVIHPLAGLALCPHCAATWAITGPPSILLSHVLHPCPSKLYCATGAQGTVFLSFMQCPLVVSCQTLMTNNARSLWLPILHICRPNNDILVN